MANDSDSDSDNLVIDMGSKPTIDPKIIPLSKKEHFTKNEQPAFTQNNSTSLKGKSRSGSPDTPPAGMKVSSYKVADSKSSKSQNTKSKIENRKCDAFEDVEDAMAAMFAGLEDDSPQKKKRPPSKAEPDLSGLAINTATILCLLIFLDKISTTWEYPGAGPFLSDSTFLGVARLRAF